QTFFAAPAENGNAAAPAENTDDPRDAMAPGDDAAMTPLHSSPVTAGAQVRVASHISIGRG
ncbi:MAG: hypothetical protein WD801_12380, partial [Gemmatimonadaceae bacterium]